MGGRRELMDISGFVATMPNRSLPDFLGYIAPRGVHRRRLGGHWPRDSYASLMLLLFIIIAAFSSHRYWAAAPAQVEANLPTSGKQ